MDTIGTVESIVSAADFPAIDAAARAWVEAGGDATGVEWIWRYIRDRVRELT